MKRFENKVALVTGGRSGIGRAIARRLSDEGARVMTAQRGEDTEQEAIAADFSDANAPVAVVEEAGAPAGRFDVLINNVGVMLEARAEKMSLDDWQRTLAINLTAPLLITLRSILILPVLVLPVWRRGGLRAAVAP